MEKAAKKNPMNSSSDTISVSFKIPRRLLAAFDRVVTGTDYLDRSKAIRKALTEFIALYATQQEYGPSSVIELSDDVVRTAASSAPPRQQLTADEIEGRASWTHGAK